MGMLFFLIIIATIFFYAWKRRKEGENVNNMQVMVMVMCLIAVISIWYDCSMRTECAYMIWLVMAVSPVINKGVITDSIQRLSGGR